MTLEKKKVKRGFILLLSGRKETIKLDPEEIPKVMEAIRTGSGCMLKQGLFNPSYYVGVIEDVDRYDKYDVEIKPLKDIFEGIVERPVGSEYASQTLMGGKMRKELGL